MQDAASDTNWNGRRVTVMGLGRFGGGVGAARFLAVRGAQVTITDLATEADLAESLGRLDDLPMARFRLGGHVEDDFRDADLIVVNPAVPSGNPFLDVARRAGVPLSSEMNLFWQLNRGRVVGVTGSNGKSTTAAMIHAILQAAGLRAWLGGNIGQSLLPEVDRITPGDWCVLELSSFQLEMLEGIQAAPDVAVVTNFTPNHLDRHGTLDAYRHAKQTILRWQSAEQCAVLNADDDDVRQWPTRGRVVTFGKNGGWRMEDGGWRMDDKQFCHPPSFVLYPPIRGLTPPARLDLLGVHNRQNALAAAAAAQVVGVPVVAIRAGLEGFQPLPHRLQLVREIGGRRFYNDSLATTAESVAVALEAFAEPVVLLAGGYDKQVDLRPLAETIATGAKAVALMGQTAGELDSLLQETNNRLNRRHVCRTLDEGFHWAVSQSVPGDVVLLSPGCASYDWFRNFAERGEQFSALVEGWGDSFGERPALARF